MVGACMRRMANKAMVSRGVCHTLWSACRLACGSVTSNIIASKRLAAMELTREPLTCANTSMGATRHGLGTRFRGLTSTLTLATTSPPPSTAPPEDGRPGAAWCRFRCSRPRVRVACSWHPGSPATKVEPDGTAAKQTTECPDPRRLLRQQHQTERDQWEQRQGRTSSANRDCKNDGGPDIGALPD